MTNNSSKKNMVFFLNWVQEWKNALTGGDRIWIGLVKGWRNKLNLTIIGSEGAINIAKRNFGTSVKTIVCSEKIKDKNYLSVFNLFKNTLKRIIQGVRVLNEYVKIHPIDFLYSTSDFPADSLPALFLKIKNPQVTWIAGFYLFACAPWKKNFPYRGKSFFRGTIYFLSQIPTYFLINKFADFVFVTSRPDVRRFITKKRDESKVIVVQGGIDLTFSKLYFKSRKMISPDKRKYLACFVGRLHYQKGVLELIDIWKKVVFKKKNARLAIVGNGYLEKEMIEKIKKYELENNIDLLGFKDGKEKYEIFKNSRIILHPAIYDSGGMAAAEAMAWGLPGVSFDLESLKDYYPRGMVKTPCFDLDQFAQNIINLDQDKDLCNFISRQAVDLIYSEWDWGKRAENIFKQVFFAK